MIPQVCSIPLLIDAKDSGGGDAWPKSTASSPAPQHTAEPSSRSAQVCHTPLLIEAKRPPGGRDAWPKSMASSPAPQHTVMPSSRSAHVCRQPLLMDANHCRRCCLREAIPGRNHQPEGSTMPRYRKKVCRECGRVYLRRYVRTNPQLLHEILPAAKRRQGGGRAPGPG